MYLVSKTLEGTVLKHPCVIGYVNEPSVVPMKVDLTGNNEPGNAMLKAVDRMTIPLLVISAPDGTEVYKADYCAVGQVAVVVEEAPAQSPLAWTLGRQPKTADCVHTGGEIGTGRWRPAANGPGGRDRRSGDGGASGSPRRREVPEVQFRPCSGLRGWAICCDGNLSPATR
jgi:hypothetical protein